MSTMAGSQVFSQVLETTEAARTRVKKWRKLGPAGFAVDVLGVSEKFDQTEYAKLRRDGDKPYVAVLDWQWEASKALVSERRVSIRSGHGVGKTCFMAWSILWFQSCFYPCKVPCTAPTGHQLSDVLWSELAKWHSVLCRNYPSIGKEFEWKASEFLLKESPRESFAAARTSRPEKPEALQGFHSENILFLLDEASGIPDNVFEVAEGALSTEGAYVLMASNPTRQDGYFYDSHHKMRESWSTIHVDGEECELVSRRYISDMAKKYGKESSIYQVRVKGDFVTAVDGVFSLALCEAAIVRNVEVVESAPIIWGVDVARFGDDASALAKRKGNIQLEITKEWFGKDIMQTTGLVKDDWDSTPRDKRPDSIHVDVIGMGAGVVDRLREMGLPAVGINVAESPAIKTKYARLRDEMWFKGREWLEARDCKFCTDDALIGELTATKYKMLSSGKIKVEDKAEMKARGVSSPNRADAWLMTFVESGQSYKKRRIEYNDGWIV